MDKATELPVLYSFVRCPYAMRARMALVEAGVNCVLREVDLKNKPIELLEASPKATVPVLILTESMIIEESLDIVYYALKDREKIFLQENKQQVNQIIRDNDTEFVKLVRSYKYPEKYQDLSPGLSRKQIFR